MKLGLYERVVGVRSKLVKCEQTNIMQHYDLQFIVAKEQGDVGSIIADYEAKGKLVVDEAGLQVDFK